MLVGSGGIDIDLEGDSRLEDTRPKKRGREDSEEDREQ
jgi:hypothetical protein